MIMSIENIKQSWKESFDKTIASIENYLTPEAHESKESLAFRELATWLIENPHNEYAYMPSGYQNYRSNPFETKYLLSTLHHALLDDGEVSFVKLKIEGEVKRVFMIFVWDNEDAFIPLCKQENQSLINAHIKGRESIHRIATTMKEKHSEKEFKVLPLLTEKDVAFEAHHDPLKFIREVEEFQFAQNQKIEKFEEKMSKVRKNKP
jgi:hypothetical protein